MLTFTITNLGDLGGNESIGTGVNDYGHCSVTARLPSVALQAAKFDPANPMLQSLPTLGGFNSTTADINLAGQIVGQATLPSNQQHATLWNPGAAPVNLNPFGGNFSEANAISDHGHVTGFGIVPGGSHAFLWTATGGSVDLGTLGGNLSFGNGVNILGHVAGQSTLANGGYRAFYCPNPGGMVDISPAGTIWSRADAINRTNTIVGEYSAPNIRRGFMWKPATGAVDISQQNSVAPLAINDNDVVVGEMSTPGSIYRHAFHFENGVLTDLNDMIPPNSGWELVTARSISNTNYITGDGVFNGARRGFLLTPLPIMPPEDPPFNIDMWLRVRGYRLVIGILKGVRDDSPGIVVIPGRGPVPVPGWERMGLDLVPLRDQEVLRKFIDRIGRLDH